MRFLEKSWAVPQPERDEWIRHWIREGFTALERLLAESPSTGAFCEGDVPSLADCCLIPQIYTAHRYGLDMPPFPTIARNKRSEQRRCGKKQCSQGSTRWCQDTLQTH